MKTLSAPLLRLLRRVALLAWLPLTLAASQPPLRTFDIPAGDAAETLRRFASQSGMQVAFPPDSVRGMRTNKVRGKLSAREALAVMTEGTELVVVEDIASGALSVRREAKVEVTEKNDGSRPMEERRAAVRNADGRVQLQDYEVVATKIDGLNNRSLLPAHEEAALPYNVISRVEIEQMGVMNTEQLFGTLTQAVNYGTNAQAQVVYSLAVGAQTISGAAVDLGFGSDQTVVLVNGRRLGLGTSISGPDISRIPLGSIERIEVLPAAAAAIYGGGAVGGAINIILRKDYNVRELTTYFGTSTNGGGTSYRVSYIDGRTFNDGRTKVTTTLDFEHSGGVRHGQREFLNRALNRFPPGSTPEWVFEGFLLQSLSGMPGTIALNGAGSLGIPGNPAARFAAVPAGLSAVQANALTPAAFNATSGTANLEGRHNRAWLLRPKTNYSIQVQLEHEILSRDRLNFYAEANAAIQEADIVYPQHFLLSLPATHPFNPFRTGVTPGFVGKPVVLYVDPSDIDDPDTAQDRHDARLTLGLKGKLRDNWEWSLDASGQYARVYGDSNNPSNYLQLLLTTITRAGAAPLSERWAIWNPFVDHSAFPVTREAHDRLFVYNRQVSYYNRNAQLAGRVLGELGELPAGAVRISAGGDVRENQFDLSSETLDSLELRQIAAAVNTGKSITTRSEATRSAFIEMTFPVFSRKWSPVGVQSFEAGLSRRWSQSNRGRNTISTTLSGNMWVTPDIMLRASLTDGFMALTDTDITDPLVQQNLLTSIVDPRRGNVSRPVTIPVRISGGNPLLRTPSADSVNFGAVLKPRLVPGLTLNVNYTKTNRVDSVATPSITDILNFPQDYPGRLERAPLAPEDAALGYTAGAITLLDTSRVNLAFRGLESFNYSVNYRLPLPGERGALTWRVNATHNNSQRSRTRPSSAEINSAGTQNIPRWRGNSSLFWENDRWVLGVTAYYTAPYSGPSTTPTPAFPTAFGIDGPKIKQAVTFDMRGSYRFPASAMSDSGWRSLLDGSTISLGIRNVFDRMPPYVTDGAGYYSRFDDPMQRFVYLEVKKNL